MHEPRIFSGLGSHLISEQFLLSYALTLVSAVSRPKYVTDILVWRYFSTQNDWSSRCKGHFMTLRFPPRPLLFQADDCFIYFGLNEFAFFPPRLTFAWLSLFRPNLCLTCEQKKNHGAHQTVTVFFLRSIDTLRTATIGKARRTMYVRT